MVDYFQNDFLPILYIIGIALSALEGLVAIELVAEFSQSGIQGNIKFKQFLNNEVIIKNKLEWTVAEYPPQLSWSICEFPVDYTQLEDRCSTKKLGKVIFELDTLIGPLSMNSTNETQTTVDVLSLIKKKGIWGRSLLISGPNDVIACATLMNDEKTSIKMAEARLNGVISGSVYFQWLGTSGETDAIIYTDLYHTRKRAPKSQHKWKIFSTDVLDSEADKSIKDCNSLQVLYDPHGHGSGDLEDKLGSVGVGMKEMYRDVHLAPLDLHNKQRHLYLVVFDNHHLDSYLVCSRIISLLPITLKCIIQAHGLRGSIVMQQPSPFVPTSVSVNWTSGNDLTMGGVRLHYLPPLPSVGHSPTLKYCEGIGNVYNPSNKPIAADSLPPGEATQDGYAVGDLTGKLGYTWERTWDSFLPLRGKHSISHRSVVIYRNGGSGVEEPWICSTLMPYTGKELNTKVPMSTAEVLFRYPIAGRILFRQPQDEWTADTSILIEMLVHADGTSLNDTNEHRWGINLDPPGKDFYNWSARCLSAGPIFDPYQILAAGKMSDDSCDQDVREGFCRVGALSERLGTISIAGRKMNSIKTSRRLFTDSMSPLTGQNSIVGKSFVLYDDHGPKARGDRLACSKITSVFRRKGVVREWFGNGIDTSVSGKVEILQQSEYDTSDLEFSLNGIHNAGEYHIHHMPVKEHLEFPCEESTLYDTYDPYKTGDSINPLPGTGTPDQYAIGDLSGNFGRLDNITHLDFAQNDSSIMLFGQQSILSRSIVIFKQDRSRCR